MNKFWTRGILASAAILLGSVAGNAQGLTSTTIDISEHFNVDGFMATEDDATMAETMGLDSGGARIQSWTMPENYVEGEPLLSADSSVAFLLGPALQTQALDAYRPDGEVFDVDNAAYTSLYLAMISGNGEFPGGTWADADVMTFTYEDGSTQEAAIGVVNDWFWTPPSWLAPVGGSDDVVVDLTLHDSDPNEFDYVWNWSAVNIEDQSHDYGKYRLANGEDFLTYILPYEEGAQLYLRAWGNIRVSISTDDLDPIFDETTEVYNSVEVHGTAFGGGGDGYFPPEQESDEAKFITINLDDYLDAGTDEFFLHFTDAAPGEAVDVEDTGNWGARVNRIGIFHGEVEQTSLGDRIWPGLIRSDGAAPAGGLQLIRKGYRLEEGKVLDSITMPSLFPNASPFLTIFAMTLATGAETSVEDFMLY